MKLLSRSFYERDTALVARELLGKLLVREYEGHTLIGRIVETEAYTSDDPASHSFHGKSQRNRAMFEEVGHAYVYFIYGMHHALNAVARKKQTAAGGVLIRAVEPVEGIELMQKLRHQQAPSHLTNGPGKLAQAFHITKALYGQDLTKKGPLYIADDGFKPKKIAATPRIGISKAIDVLWRFVLSDSHFLSKKHIK